jgi:MFS family permease
VVVLGWASLLNDAASEMVTPLLPLFLTATLGAGPAVVGLIEGVAEATASLLKLVSGRLADRGVSPKRLVAGGYGLSNVARPLIGAAGAWGFVLALRFLDRVGKGVRTSPRDALVAANVAAAQRGHAFGFQRAMDHAGAVIGPLLAFVLLRAGVEMALVFLASAAVGLGVLPLVGLGLPRAARLRDAAPPLRLGALDPRLRGLVLAAGALALASPPEAFLVLWLTAHGLAVAWVPIAWAVAHAVKALVAGPAGRLSDQVGRLPVLSLGWSARIALLALMGSVADGPAVACAGFLGYAAALSATEGAERALVGDLARDAERGTAFGLYHLTSGLFALPGAFVFGLIWQRAGARAAFSTAAALACGALATLLAASLRASRGSSAARP